MDLPVLIPPELEEFIRCSNCHLLFNETDALPKLLKCRHYFCLKCIRHLLIETNTGNAELYCVLCWQKTILAEPKAKTLPTQNAIIFLIQNLRNLSDVRVGGASSEQSTYGQAAAEASLMERSLSLTSSSASSSGSAHSSFGFTSIGSESSWTLTQLFGSAWSQSSYNSHYDNDVDTNNNEIENNNQQNNNASLVVLINEDSLEIDTPDKSDTSTSDTSSSMLQYLFEISGNNQNQSDVPNINENCILHAMPNTRWCSNCLVALCRACASMDTHREHNIKLSVEAKQQLLNDISDEFRMLQALIQDLTLVVTQQHELMSKLLEYCDTVKNEIESELAFQRETFDLHGIHETVSQLSMEQLDQQSLAQSFAFYNRLCDERQRLMVKYESICFQHKFDEWIGGSKMILSFEGIQRAMLKMHGIAGVENIFESMNRLAAESRVGCGMGNKPVHPFLTLANYCIAQMYTRDIIKQREKEKQNQQQLIQLILESQPNEDILPQAPFVNQPSDENNNGLMQEDFQFLNTTEGISQWPTYSIDVQANSSPDTNSNSSSSTIFKALTGSATDLINRNLENAFKQQPPQQAQLPMSEQQNILSEDSHSRNSRIIAPIGQERAQRRSELKKKQERVNLVNIAYNLRKLHLIQMTQDLVEQQQRRFQEFRAITAEKLLRNPSVRIYPILFFDFNMNDGQHKGRVLIEVHNDVAPKMSQNFMDLALHRHGFGYKGCHVFQCWNKESIITGDFETNSGRGGHAACPPRHFLPDETKIMAVRGTIGMRRCQWRHQNFRLIGSQFRIILREMCGFTAIFAFVLDGLEFIDMVAKTGDPCGRPNSRVFIEDCGEFKIGGSK